MGQLRERAMKLHTREQAREGEKEAEKEEEGDVSEWQPTRRGYIQFLIESRAVHEAMEAAMEKYGYEELLGTGLERCDKIDEDLEWLQSQGDKVPEGPKRGGPGEEYAELLEELAKDDPAAFLCHFYNVNFAHASGGRMIGKMVSDRVFDGREFAFYRYEKPVSQVLADARTRINRFADIRLGAEGRARCLDETERSFDFSGPLLRLIFDPYDEASPSPAAGAA